MQKRFSLLLILCSVLMSINAAVYDVANRNLLGDYMSSSTDYQGDTIRLTNNFSITNTIYVYGTKVLDLNGHKLTSSSNYAFYAQNGSKLTVYGSEEDTIQCNTYVFILANAELTIDGGTYLSGLNNRPAVIGTTTTYSSDKSTINIKNGKLDCNGQMAIVLKQYDELMMTGGEIRGLNAASGSSVTIKAGTIAAGTDFYYTHAGSTLAADVAPGSVVALDGVITETESLTNSTYTQQIVVTAPAENQHLVIAKPDATSHGTVTGTGLYTTSESATLTATPASGYKFVKWSDENTENPRTLTVTSDVTLTAIFDYDITLSWDGYKAKWTDVPEATNYWVTLYKDGTAVSSNGAEVPGYVGNVTEYDMQSLIEEQGNGTYTFTIRPYVGSLGNVSAPSPEKEFIVYVMYTVTFNSGGGSAVASQEVREGTTATEPSKPTKEGFKFGGWYTDEELTTPFDFSSSITKNTTLYAKWIEKVTKVTTMTWDGYKAQWNAVNDASAYWLSLYRNGIAISSEGGSQLPGGIGNVTEYDLQSLIEANGNGTYTFTVMPSFNGSMGEISEPSPEQVFKITCSVVFLDWDGTTLKEEDVRMNQDATAPADPTREGYTFTGWDKSFTNVTEDLTVNALYEINKYTITIVTEHGIVTAKDAEENPVDLSLPIEYGKVIWLIATPDEGYEEDEWTNYNPASGLTVKENVTITVTFKQLIYHVIFVDYDDTVLKEEDVPYKNAATAPADPTREGYTFIGWDKDFSAVTEDMTIKAQYEQAEGIEDILGGNVQCTKVLLDGQIFILRGEKTYTLQGQEIK